MGEFFFILAEINKKEAESEEEEQTVHEQADLVLHSPENKHMVSNAMIRVRSTADHFLAQLFLNKNCRYCRDPGVVGVGVGRCVGVGVTNFHLEIISVITEDIYFKLGT